MIEMEIHQRGWKFCRFSQNNANESCVVLPTLARNFEEVETERVSDTKGRFLYRN